MRRNPHTDAHVRLAHTAATEPTPSASRRPAPHAQTPPLPPHPCPRRPAAADSPHPTPVPTSLPPPQHPALAHIRRAWPGAHRINHQRRVRVARRHTGPAATSTRARPASGPAGQFRITRGAGSSNALNRQCRTTGADTRAAFVDNASRHPATPIPIPSYPIPIHYYPNPNPLPSHYHPQGGSQVIGLFRSPT